MTMSQYDPLPATSQDNSSDSWITEQLLYDAYMTDCKAPENLTGQKIYELAHDNPEALRTAPHKTVIGRPDEVAAARKPILRYEWEE